MKIRDFNTMGIVTMKDLINTLRDYTRLLYRIINNGMKFADQFDATEKTVSDTGSANTEFSITHGLGRIPIGYFVKTIDKGAVIYESGTAWDIATIYLKATAANCAVTLYIY